MLTQDLRNLEIGKNPIDTLGNYFGLLVIRNREKYSSYIFAIRWFARILVLFHGGVSKAMNYQYGGLRIIDDRIDGDLKNIDIDIVEYTQKRFRVLTALTNPSFSPETPEDFLLKESISIARKHGKEKEIIESIRMIIASMFFDAKRIKEFRETSRLNFPGQNELERHFFELDVIGTGMGMLVYLGSQDIPGDLEKLKNIGRACRIEYNLHDFVEDLKQGVVNISQEEAKKYGITESDLENIVQLPTNKEVDKNDPALIWHQEILYYPESIKRWFRAQIIEYEDCMHIFKDQELPSFPMLTRIVFHKFYIQPTRRNINRLKTLFPI